MHGSLGHKRLLSREVSCETFWPGCVSGSVTFASCEKVFVRPTDQAGFSRHAWRQADRLLLRLDPGAISQWAAKSISRLYQQIGGPEVAHVTRKRKMVPQPGPNSR